MLLKADSCNTQGLISGHAGQPSSRVAPKGNCSYLIVTIHKCHVANTNSMVLQIVEIIVLILVRYYCKFGTSNAQCHVISNPQINV